MSELEAACEVLNRHRHRGIATWQVGVREDDPQKKPFIFDGSYQDFSNFEALAVARALEPDPQAEADRELGAALRGVLALGNAVRVSPLGASGRYCATDNEEYAFDYTPAAALRALAARLAGEGAP